MDTLRRPADPPIRPEAAIELASQPVGDDLILTALRRYRSIAKAHRYGGYGGDFLLAERALEEFNRRRKAETTKQLGLFDRESTETGEREA